MRECICTLTLFTAVLPAFGQALPADVYPDSLSRFPVVKRDQLDEKGKKSYDFIAGGPGKAVLPTGPASIGLYSPGVYEPLRGLNDYLRKDSVLGDRLTELAILVTARELDDGYVWGAHEVPALKAGTTQAVIDVIKYNKENAGLPEKDAVVIRFGRQLFREKKISSEVCAQAVAFFGQRGIVDLTAVMADYQFNFMLLTMADQHLPPDRQGMLPPRK
jgi:4-carboxymuconolactone decarboxylase